MTARRISEQVSERPAGGLDRRRFLGQGLASALLLLHAGPAQSISGRRAPAGDQPPRLLDLRLRTAASIETLVAFYQGGLGLDAIEASDERVVFAAGLSRLTFERQTGGAAPFYHFAFNIPENKLLAARHWQLERSEILTPWPDLRDSRYPDDVVWFRHWNAHSVFFLDPAGNVVEYIARHDLANQRSGDFSPRDILYASEIAFVTDDVLALADELGRTFGVERYGSASEAFAALGDEHGLLLVMRRGRELAFGRGRAAEVFPAEVDLRLARHDRWTGGSLPYRVGAAPAPR